LGARTGWLLALEDRINNSTFHAITPAARPAAGSPSLAVTTASPAARSKV
jgi:hypothetical protein